MLLNLQEFQQALSTYRKLNVSASTIARYKPKQCVWPGRRGHHNVCTCKIHENYKFLLVAIDYDKSLSNFVSMLLCPNENGPLEECCLGYCSNCPKYDVIDNQLAISDDDQISYEYWECTDGAALESKEESGEYFRELLKEESVIFAAHHFHYSQQQQFTDNLKEGLNVPSIYIMVWLDFGENHSFLHQDPIALDHWSNSQCTIHPCCVLFYDKNTNKRNFKTYFVESNYMKHSAEAVHVFIKKVMAIVKSEWYYEGIELVYYISDGAPSQYKNWKTMCHLFYHKNDFGVPAIWIFLATSHGKSICDGLSGVVKSAARLFVLKKQGHIRDLEEFYLFCTNKLQSEFLQFVKITKNDVEADLIQQQIRFAEKAKTIEGTRKFHHFEQVGDEFHCKEVSTSTNIVRFVYEDPPVPLIEFGIGDYVAIKHKNTYIIGQVVDEDLDNDNDDGRLYEAQIMRQSKGTNSFTWPSVRTTKFFSKHEVIQFPISNLVAVKQLGRQIFQLDKATFNKLEKKQGG